MADEKQNNKLNEVGEVNLSCRMYEQRFPEVDDLVMVEVLRVEDMGAHVALKEYNDIEGMIMLTELSRRRIRSVNKIIKVGRAEVVVVLRVDKEKGYIDLSKRRVSDEEVAKCQERFNKSKAVQSILKHVATTTKIDLETLYTKFGWPLYRKYGHAYDAFRIAISDPESVFEGLDVDASLRESILNIIKHRLSPQPVKVRADIEVTCFKYEGIEAVKAALRKGEAVSTDLAPVKIRLVAPPLFVVVTTSVQKETAMNTVTKSLEAIQEEISKYNGEIVVKVPPRTVQDRDEQELSSLLAKLGKQNSEIPGDDENDSDGE